MPESWASLDHGLIESRLLAEFGRSRSAGPGVIEYYRDPAGHVVDVSNQDRLETFVQAVYSAKRPRLISALEPGPAFNAQEWEAVVSRVSEELAPSGESIVVQWWGLTARALKGYWLGESSGLRLSQPPEDWVRLDEIVGEHPVMLQFPLALTKSAAVNAAARSKTAAKYGLLLNALIIGGMNGPRARSRSHWATRAGSQEPLWVSDGYVPATGFRAESETYAGLSNLEQVELVSAAEYYSDGWYAADALQLPDSLDSDICAFMSLPPATQEDVQRALYWFERARRVWDVSESMYFLAHASAIEVLTESQIGDACPTCGKPAIGPTRAFKEFLVKFGDIDVKSADALYTLRSHLTHGELLLLRDEELESSMNRLGLAHDEAIRLISRSVRRAIIGFVRAQALH